jgi:hypothetical protein
MPELPDVESFNRLVNDRGRGRTIAQVVTKDPGMLQDIAPDAVTQLDWCFLRCEARDLHALRLADRGLSPLRCGASAASEPWPKKQGFPTARRILN